MRGKRYPLLVVALLLWVSALYANTLESAFHFDDRWNILDNAPVRVDSLSPGALYSAAKEGAYSSRPVATLSFAINYYFGGYDVRGYHVFNVGVHLLAGLGLLFLILEVLRLPRFEAHFKVQRRRQIALVAAALWLCHPLQIQAVTYIVQRMASMAAMFTVWSLVVILWGLRQTTPRRSAAFAAAALLFLLALGSKETAVVLPVFVVVGPFLLGRGPLRRRRLAVVVLGGGLAGLLAVSLGRGPATTLSWLEQIAGRSDTWLTIPRAFVRGLSLFAAPLPSRLSLEHYVPFSTSLLEPASTLPALVALLSVVALSIWLIGRSRLCAVALLWFLSIFLLETSVVSHDPLMEHRLYLPSMGLCLLLALGFDAARRRAGSRRALGVLLALLALLSAFTVQRNRAWRTAVSLGEDNVRKAPQRVRAYSEIVWGLMQEGRIAEANAYFDRAKALNPTRADDLLQLGVIAEAARRHAEAVAILREALSLNPGQGGRVRMELAKALVKTGRLEEALAELHAFQISARIPSEQRRAEQVLNSIMASLRQRLLAQPGDLRTRARLAALLIGRKQPREAAEHLRAILERDPNNATIWSNLGFCRWDLGELAEAERCQRQALRLNPRLPGAHYGLGMIMDRLGRRPEAERCFRRYLSLAPPGDMFRVYAEERLGGGRTN